MRLDHKTALPDHLIELFNLFGRLLCRRLLERLDGDDIHFDHFGVELFVHLDLLVLTEDRLVDLFGEHFDLGVAKLHHGRLEILLRHVRLRLDIGAGDLINAALVEEAQNAGLVDVDGESVFLSLRVLRLDLYLPVLVQPGQLLVHVRVLVPNGESVRATHQFARQGQRRWLNTGPCAIREHLNVEFSPADIVIPAVILCELVLYVPAQLDVLHHLTDFADDGGTTLDLELLDHYFLVLVRQTCLVDQAAGKLLLVRLHEDVAAMQAPEKTDHSVEPIVDFVLSEALQPDTLFLVTVLCHVGRGVRLLVHKIHKGLVSALLEQNVIGERVLHHDVHLRLETQQPLSELDGVLHVLIQVDQRTANLLNVGLHLVKNLLIFGIVSREHVEKQVQLVKCLLLEEGHYAVLLLHHNTCHIGHQGLDAYLHHLGLGLRLQPKVSVAFLMLKRSEDLPEILVAVVVGVPGGREALKGGPAQLEEGRLKLCHVVVEVGCALPEKATITPNGLLVALLAQINVHPDGRLQRIPIDLLLVTIARNLVLDRPLQLSFQPDDNPILELLLAVLAKRRQEVRLHVVNVEVVEEPVQQHGENGVVVPLQDEFEQEILPELPRQARLDLLVEVVLHDLLVHVVDLLAAVVRVALLVDGRAALLEDGGRCYLGLLLAQEGDQGLDIVGLDERLALLQIHHVNVVNIHGFFAVFSIITITV